MAVPHLDDCPLNQSQTFISLSSRMKTLFFPPALRFEDRGKTSTTRHRYHLCLGCVCICPVFFSITFEEHSIRLIGPCRGSLRFERRAGGRKRRPCVGFNCRPALTLPRLFPPPSAVRCEYNWLHCLRIRTWPSSNGDHPFGVEVSSGSRKSVSHLCARLRFSFVLRHSSSFEGCFFFATGVLGVEGHY